MASESISNGFPGAEENSLLSIRYKRGHLQLVDQRKLPLETVYVEISNSIAGWHAIKDMVVRGAPAIAIAAALSLAVEVTNLDSRNGVVKEACEYIQKQLEYLVSSRPTAVNLFDAAKRLKEVTEEAAARSSNAEDVYKAYIEAAEAMLAADVAANKAIGLYGAKLISDHVEGQNSGKALRILTHCNTGSLATAAYGTALGVIRTLHSQGLLETVYFTETRPFNQGSRLTAYELIHDRVPAILIADSAVASLQGSGQIDAVIVGADRIAGNGDTANKIGTYSLALSAFHHNVPFYVAAPVTTLDKFLPSGKNIVIEERSSVELTHSHGGQGSQIAPSGVSVWNPAFDITPAKLIKAIITDKGIITKQDSSVFNIQAFLSESNKPSDGITTSGVESMDTSGALVEDASKPDIFVESSEKYYILNERSVTEYIKSYPKLARRLGGMMEDWEVREVGDGNLNFVYIILGPNGSLVLKQSVPYVRCVGESWPMSPERSFYEVLVLVQHGRFCPDHVPEVYHFNRTMATIVMQYLQPPSIILRKGLIAGIIYPHLAEHMSDYMAKTLYHTSLVANSTKTHRSEVAQFCGNIELCRLTEQVIFTEPYMIAQNNRWTSPQLDEDAKAVREDHELKLEVADLKAKFCERSQALIHGDLHTGSIMVTTSSTHVIDPEFAFYGPIGFDVGAFLGNLILAFFSQDGHAKYEGERKEYKSWILSTIGETWSLFYSKFISLWNANWDSCGDAYPADVYKSATEKQLAQTIYMKEIFHDSLGFAAAKMIRRIVGIAHVEDFESIQDLERRAICERQALNCAKQIMKQRHSFSSIGQVVELVSGQ